MSSVTQESSTEPRRSAFRSHDDASLREIFGVFRRHRLAIVLTILALTVPATLYGLWLEPQYTASATVLIEPQADRVISVEQVSPELPQDAAIVETQANLIRSRELITQVMEDLDLFDDPNFLPTPGFFDFGEPFSEEEERRIAVEIFEDSLYVGQVGESYVLEVSFTSPDPFQAAEIANHVAELHVERQLREKIDATQEANQWITERLDTQQQELQEAEQRVAEIRSANQFVDGGAPLTATQLDELKRELIRIGAERARIASRLALIDRLRANGGGTDSLAEVLDSPLITQLRIQEAALTRRDNPAIYLENHPRMVALREELANLSAQADQEVNRIVTSLRNEQGALSSQEAILQFQLQEAEDQNTLDNSAAVGLQEAEREAAAKRTLYETLLLRQQETIGLQGILEPDARIVSAADVPSGTSTPGPVTIGAVSLVASALLAGMLALVLEQADRTVRTVRQLERVLGIPGLALVPRVTRKEARAAHDLMRRKPRSAYAQSVRGLYTQLGAAAPGAKVILVTSSLPGEGKTSLAASLAVVAAQAEGLRTVLVDLNLWHPGVAGHFGREPRGGVADLLTAEKGSEPELDEALLKRQPGGIDILPAGQWAPGVMPSLTREWVVPLFDELRRRYDRIIVDSPPLLRVSDGRILAAAADATILAVRWGHTNRDAASAGLQVLRDASANVLGAVLTQVKLKRYAVYGEADGWQYQHGAREKYVQ